MAGTHTENTNTEPPPYTPEDHQLSHLSTSNTYRLPPRAHLSNERYNASADMESGVQTQTTIEMTDRGADEAASDDNNSSALRCSCGIVRTAAEGCTDCAEQTCHCLRSCGSCLVKTEIGNFVLAASLVGTIVGPYYGVKLGRDGCHLEHKKLICPDKSEQSQTQVGSQVIDRQPQPYEAPYDPRTHQIATVGNGPGSTAVDLSTLRVQSSGPVSSEGEVGDTDALAARAHIA